MRQEGEGEKKFMQDQLNQQLIHGKALQDQLNQQKYRLTELSQLTQINKYQIQLNQLQHQSQLNEQKDHLNHLQDRDQKNLECLSYVFCAGITRYIHPLLSWIDKKNGIQNNKNNKINETIQKDTQILQTLSFIATICGGKIDNYCNGFTPPVYDLGAAILRAMLLNIQLPFYSAYLLVNCCDDIVGHSKKNDNHTLKTIRELPQPIKTLGRLFIEWDFGVLKNRLLFFRVIN